MRVAIHIRLDRQIEFRERFGEIARVAGQRRGETIADRLRRRLPDLALAQSHQVVDHIVQRAVAQPPEGFPVGRVEIGFCG